MPTVYQNNIITLSANFVSATTGQPADPMTVQVEVLDVNNNVILIDNAQQLGVGYYTYQWQPTLLGNFTFEFIGTWAINNTTIIQTPLTIIAAQNTYTPTQTLIQDQFINFLVNPQPFVLDPEEFSIYYPEADLFQIAELIAQFSSEAQNILLLSNTDPDTLTQIMQLDPIVNQTVLDYVQAATLCALTRIYDPTAGAQSSVITLSDLTIQTNNTLNQNPGRATATTWCELAGIIRDELYAISRKAGIKAIVKGSKYRNPIPRRKIRHMEWRDWSPYAGGEFRDDAGPSDGWSQNPWS